MSDKVSAVGYRSRSAMADIDAAAWDACAGSDNPFLSHAFLRVLEESGSVGGKSGWNPFHLLAEDDAGRLLACAPLYLKAHSFGEYVFDWAWAEAWQRAGRRYYPKLQGAVPFTPVSGRRLLTRPGAADLSDGLAGAMEELAQQAELSSVHVTFCTQAEAERLGARGWLVRLGEQYHWHNQGFATFDDFLSTLASRKRKAVRRERERAGELGLAIRTLSGADIKARHWDAFHRFYVNTVDRKWGQAYLTRDFFHRLGETMGDKVALVVAEDGARVVAGALNLIGTEALFGRNWGAARDYPFLHFEMCYYRAIDLAIERGLSLVEAGAQGEHKIARGYLPVPTWSAHWIREAPLRAAVADFLESERRAVAEDIIVGREQGPYRQAPTSPL